LVPVNAVGFFANAEPAAPLIGKHAGWSVQRHDPRSASSIYLLSFFRKEHAVAFLTALAAEAGGGIWRKLLPWGLLLLVTVILTGVVMIRSTQLESARVELASARHDGEIAKADTQRWMAATAGLRKIIDDQAMQLKRQAADLARAQQIADESARMQAAQVTLLDTQLQSLKARADAHPTDIRPLGPIVTDVLNGLRRVIADQPAASPAAD
jgi:hypothetical protein